MRRRLLRLFKVLLDQINDDSLPELEAILKSWLRIVSRAKIAACLLLAAPAWGQTFNLQWEEKIDLGGIERARGVVVSGNRAVVVGHGLVDVLVRAYDLQTGTLAWWDQFPADSYVGLAESDGRVYISSFLASSSQVLLLAYDVPTGNRIWESRWEGSISVQGAAVGQGVYVVGYGGSGVVDLLVRAYDKATGSLLWVDQLDSGGNDAGWKVATDGSQVYVAGQSGTDARLRAYSSNGALAWEKSWPNGLPTALLTNQGQVVIGGNGFSASAYDASGLLLWSENPSAGVSDIAADQARLFISGDLLRATDLNGNLAWTVTPPENQSLALAGDILFLGGAKNVYQESTTISSEFLVRAYNATNGALLYEDLSNNSQDSLAYDLASAGDRAVAVGWSGGDFLVRGYGVTLPAQVPVITPPTENPVPPQPAPEPVPAPSPPPTSTQPPTTGTPQPTITRGTSIREKIRASKQKRREQVKRPAPMTITRQRYAKLR